MKIGIYPGSFDPITIGHLDIIYRATKIFDKLIILLSFNPNKKSFFSLEEKKKMIIHSIEKFKSKDIIIDSWDGLLIDYMKLYNIFFLVKGIRNISDFDYEYTMHLCNKKLYSKLDTILLMANPENIHISSSLVREIISMNGDIEKFVPDNIYQIIKNYIK
ncbi:MAG: pantetheine-phosphate adenylyltransferase [Oscillospiraceae bacterium]|nr:pantetheine-phosphate adenylyltransferase [Oscillospiraceae bacterium]